MEHSVFFPFAELEKQKISIREISKLVISFYKKLSIKNSSFNKLFIVSERKPLYDFIDINHHNSEKILAEEILHQNINDIKKIDNIKNPDIDYTPGISILFSLEAKINGETLITLHFAFGVKLRSYIGPIIVNKLCFITFEETYFFLETLINTFKTLYATVKIKDRDFTKKTRIYKAPLGWITYFSNNYELQIPDDLEGIEYEYTDKGKYLILTRENFTLNKETYEKQKEKLLKIMEEIKKRVPEYSKK